MKFSEIQGGVLGDMLSKFVKEPCKDLQRAAAVCPAFRENEMREVKSAVCSPVGSPLPDSVALRPVLEALLNLLCSTYASALWGRASCLQQKTFLET